MPAQYTSIELIPSIVAALRKEFNTGNICIILTSQTRHVANIHQMLQV